MICLLYLWLHNAYADSVIGECTMRVHFTVGGGIAYLPGLAKPVVIDSGQLTRPDAAELERLVEAANFFALPSKINPPHPGAADYVQYKLTVEQGQQQHTVEWPDIAEDPKLRQLRLFLQVKANEVREEGGGGKAPE
ncbi:MAG TPA: protealysin inhibitor emfourin [Noviherbaspirillum sp.]